MPRRESSSQQPNSGSRAPRGTRQPVTVAGRSRRDDRTALPTAPPSFSTVPPSGHAMSQLGEEEEHDDDDDMEGSTYAPSRMGQTSASYLGPSRGRTRQSVPRAGGRMSRNAPPTYMSTVPEDDDRTRTGVRRATTIAPTRATAVDVDDHGVFESDEEDEEGGTFQPSAYGGTRTYTGQSTTGSARMSERPTSRTQAQSTTGITRMSERPASRTQAQSTTGSTRMSERPTSMTQAQNTAAPSRRPRPNNVAGGTGSSSTRTRRPTEYDRNATTRPSGRTQARRANLGTVNEEEADGEEEPLADPVRAQIQWFDARHPPPCKPRGCRDENLIYQIEGDDYEVYQYSIPSERADGGLSILREIDRRAQHLRDPHFSSLELWMRAQNSGFLRKIIDDDEGYSYWTIENHNYDIAWACAQQGWWILGVGVGKDKGNFFMEQKDGRS